MRLKRSGGRWTLTTSSRVYMLWFVSWKRFVLGPDERPGRADADEAIP